MALGPEKPDLTRLVEEFPLTAALVAKNLGELESFLSDPLYETWIKEGGSISIAFGTWLASKAKDVRSSTVASLELAMARLRRQRDFPVEQGDRFILSSRAVLVDRPPGTADLHAELVERLGPKPVQAVAEGRFERRGLPPLGVTGIETLLLVRAGESSPGTLPTCTVEHPEPAVASLLVFAQDPRTRSELDEEARAVGAEASLIDLLVTRGLLERCQ